MEIQMNARKATLLIAGTLAAFALAAAPTSKTREVTVGAQPTPYSADHARIDAPVQELPAQF
jgi:ABC-type nitrate/sulfonate/bicarbonate transport system substrate-binding protein